VGCRCARSVGLARRSAPDNLSRNAAMACRRPSRRYCRTQTQYPPASSCSNQHPGFVVLLQPPPHILQGWLHGKCMQPAGTVLHRCGVNGCTQQAPGPARYHRHPCCQPLPASQPHLTAPMPCPALPVWAWPVGTVLCRAHTASSRRRGIGAVPLRSCCFEAGSRRLFMRSRLVSDPSTECACS
jgi:hypothetical protein